MADENPPTKSPANPASPASAAEGSDAPRSPPKDIAVTSFPTLEADEVEEEEDVLDDGDSGVGSFQSSTASMRDELIKQRKEHGRKYQGYLEAKLQNHLVWVTLERKLYHAPVKSLGRVLDVGCGTGQWTIDFADEHPESEVIGVDLAPVQPKVVPPNLVFEVDDLEQPWTFTNKFNYIHTEAMIGALQDWPKYFAQSFDALEPDGYLEIHDIDFMIRCDDDSMPDDSAIVKWHLYLKEAAANLGIKLGSLILDFPEMMQKAGYVDISVRQFKWPINTWPKEKKYKEIGWFAYENFNWGCESMSLALLTRGLGWNVDEVRVFMALLRKDFANKRMHAYWNFYAIHGRKPVTQD
ncbi:hypothetical protein jhhlp_008265 [Lomentospora prolificans]|uniref:Methyltransferase domain-containing protein n=1 Tax=Lomentospora prolificans TaxID=41688 RepID=A0A2N3MXJ5_9PEZI|nr:hypothetical protein jhhlp_008265 [Lomentospora prolificans]